jgi:hypothetical protein
MTERAHAQATQVISPFLVRRQNSSFSTDRQTSRLQLFGRPSGKCKSDRNRAPKTRLVSESGWAKRSSGRVACSAERRTHLGDLVRNFEGRCLVFDFRGGV